MITTSSLLGRARECSRQGLCSMRDGRLVIRTLGLGLGDLKEIHILSRTLRWCKDGLVFAADVRHAKEVIEESESASSKPLSSPVVVDSASGNHADNQRLLGDVEKQAVPADRRERPVRLQVFNLMFCQCRLCSRPR